MAFTDAPPVLNGFPGLSHKKDVQQLQQELSGFLRSLSHDQKKLLNYLVNSVITYMNTLSAATGDLLAANNLSDVDNAATSRQNLGLEIGVDVQAWDTVLDDLSAATAFLPTFCGMGGVTSSFPGLKRNSTEIQIRLGDDSGWADIVVGDITASSNIMRSVETGITASTTQTQGQTPLTKDFNHVSTVANVDDVVTLPSAVAGMQIVIYNAGANQLQIFPASGDQIDGNAVDASVKLTASTTGIFWASNTVVWLSAGEFGRVTA